MKVTFAVLQHDLTTILPKEQTQYEKDAITHKETV